MKPVDQTRFSEGDTKGNCFAAVVASILEIEISELPELATPSQVVDLCEWLRPRGLWWVDVDSSPIFAYTRFYGYHEIGGIGTRGVRHSVVGYKGEIIFDPHPSREGLLPDRATHPWTFGFFVRVDPRS